MEKTAKTIEKQEKSKVAFDKCPSILGNSDYMPTMLQSRILWLVMNCEVGKSVTQIMIDNGHNPDLWFKWKIRYPGFEKWFKDSVHVVFKDQIPILWNALFRRAKTHDTGAAKLCVQRFDPEFTERSSTDNKHTFAGFTPGNADKSRERERKAIDSKELE